MDYAKFDHIFVMDASNYRNTLNVAHSPAHTKKVQMMLNVSQPGKNKQVPDPYFGGDEGFEDVYRMLDDACEAFLDGINGKG
jgi:protein-tyrosine phosphatase